MINCCFFKKVIWFQKYDIDDIGVVRLGMIFQEDIIFIDKYLQKGILSFLGVLEILV